MDNQELEQPLVTTPRYGIQNHKSEPDPSRPKPFEPTLHLTSNYQETGEGIFQIDNEDKPRIIKITASLFFLIAVVYALISFTLLGIVIVLDGIIGAAGSIFHFIKYFPTFGLIPIILAIVCVWFCLVAFKLRHGSRVSYWMGLITLLIVPGLVSGLSRWLITPFIQVVAAGSDVKEVIPTSMKEIGNLRNYSLIYLFSFIALFLLLVSYKKYSFLNRSLSKKTKISLLIITGLIVLPVVTVTSAKFIWAQDTDNGYTKMQKQVNFHLYRPSVLPLDLVQDSKYSITKELAGYEGTVQVVYNLPFPEWVKSQKPQMIILRQVGVDNSFDWGRYLSANFEGYDPPEKVNLNQALNQTAYFLHKKLGETDLSSVTFVTTDKVLVYLISPAATKDQLTQLAMSLR